MNRVKTFDSTGVAPNGRLFAGDLNLIQDTVAALSDFAATHDVGILRVGDTSLALQKFGTGELWFNSLLRVSGILRGLGGIVPGTFTTTQRDAIAAGSRPYGLEILNTTTNRREMNYGTDAVPDWRGVGENAAGVYRKIGRLVTRLTPAAGIGTYVVAANPSGAPGVTQNDKLASSAEYIDSIYIDPADHAVPGLNTRYRARMWVVVNAVAPVSNFTGAFVKLSTPGGASGSVKPGSTVTQGSIPAINAPGAGSVTVVDSGDISGITAGHFYGLVSISAAFAANASVVVGMEIDVHNV